MKDWEVVADNLKKAGWSVGWVSALDVEGRTIWIVDAHGYGKRFIVRADEILTAFVELQSAIHEFAVSLKVRDLKPKKEPKAGKKGIHVRPVDSLNPQPLPPGRKIQ